jgi:hypothetical protein
MVVVAAFAASADGRSLGVAITETPRRTRLSGQVGQPIVSTFRETKIDHKVAPFDVARFA